jgi:hypothetical protein
MYWDQEGQAIPLLKCQQALSGIVIVLSSSTGIVIFKFNVNWQTSYKDANAVHYRLPIFPEMGSFPDFPES